MNTVLADSVIRATKEIFKSAMRRSVSSTIPAEGALSGLSGGISVEITMIGGVTGAIIFKCSIEIAVKMASQILGTAVAANSDEMVDAIAELLNMIVGSAKTYYSKEADSFNFSIPTSIIGQDYKLHIKPNGDDTLAAIAFEYSDGSFGIEVFAR